MAFDQFTRRHFFYGTLLAGAVPAGGFGSTPSLKALGYKSPNEKLNIASIGAGGKAASDIHGCAPTENIVALCDVDDKQAAAIYKQFEKPPKYKDFRKMLDKEGNSIDAVIVTIPDHMHATAAIHCMERGKHVYTQKPLVRTIKEARMMVEAANKYKVATQMGNQGYSNEGTRQCAEMIWGGEIGNVTEVHAWTDRPIWPQGLTSIPAASPVPPTLDWDLWLGIANFREYTSGGEGYPEARFGGNFYQHFNWRGFYDFGCGALGDMACHILGAPNMALKLGAPTSVECIKKEGASNFQFPKASTIKFEFAARGNMPPVTLYWYDGLKEQPKIKGVPEGEYLGDLPRVGGGGRGQGRGAGAAAGSGGRSGGGPRTGHGPDERLRGQCVPLERCVPAGFGASARDARWQPVHRRQGHDHYRDLWRTDAPAAGGEDARLQVPLAAVDPFAGALPRLDPRLQGRRPGLLQLQRVGAVRGVDAAGRDRAARGRQAGIRPGEDADHEQRGSEQVSGADGP